MMVTSVLSLFLDHFGKGLTMLGMFLRLRLTHLAVPEAEGLPQTRLMPLCLVAIAVSDFPSYKRACALSP